VREIVEMDETGIVTESRRNVRRARLDVWNVYSIVYKRRK
jgi:hypothetical protein